MVGWLVGEVGFAENPPKKKNENENGSLLPGCQRVFPEYLKPLSAGQGLRTLPPKKNLTHCRYCRLCSILGTVKTLGRFANDLACIPLGYHFKSWWWVIWITSLLLHMMAQVYDINYPTIRGREKYLSGCSWLRQSIAICFGFMPIYSYTSVGHPW